MIQDMIPKLESNYLADILYDIYDELENRNLDVSDEGELEPIYIRTAKDVASKMSPDIVTYDSAQDLVEDDGDTPPPVPPMPEDKYLAGGIRIQEMQEPMLPVDMLKAKARQHKGKMSLLDRAGLNGETAEELESISRKIHGDYIASEVNMTQATIRDKFEDFIMYSLLTVVMVSMLTLAYFYIRGKIIWF